MIKFLMLLTSMTVNVHTICYFLIIVVTFLVTLQLIVSNAWNIKRSYLYRNLIKLIE